MDESGRPLQSFFENFFTVAFRQQTYKNILYLLVSFPLGIFYFIFLITGLSLGAGLIPIFVGLPVIMFVFFMSRRFMAFERTIARGLLGVNVPITVLGENYEKGFWRSFKANIFNLESWKSIVYLLIKFPAGICAFVAMVTFTATSFALISTPVVYSILKQNHDVDMFEQDIFSFIAPGYFTSMEKSIAAILAGILLLLISMHLFNLIAYIYGKFIEIAYRGA